jgi:hypothetical protein
MVRSQIPPMISDAPKTQLEVKHFCTRFCWLEQLMVLSCDRVDRLTSCSPFPNYCQNMDDIADVTTSSSNTRRFP